MSRQLSEVLPELQKYFEPEQHKDRQLKGGGKWFFLSYQTIRDRLNQVCPDEWSDKYILSHREADGDPIYLCELTICGVTRTGIGDKSNEPSPYGTPSQRAFRKAFCDAAEQFGIAAYLDEQKDDKTKGAFLKYMQQRNDGRAASYHHQNNGTTPARSTAPAPKQTKPFGQTTQSKKVAPPATNVVPLTKPTAEPVVISPEQCKRFWTIARSHKWTDDAVKLLVSAWGFTSSKLITTNAYEGLCAKLEDAEMLAVYLDRAAKEVAAEREF